MISGLSFTFVLFPCIGAVAAAAAIWDWRLAAAIACGALGLVALHQVIPPMIYRLAVPVLMGVAIGALVQIPVLLWRPTTDVWGRMIASLVPTFFIFFIFMLIALNGA